jgi:hypothetical protein
VQLDLAALLIGAKGVTSVDLDHAATRALDREARSGEMRTEILDEGFVVDSSGPRQREATGDEEGSTDYHAGNLPGTSRSPSAVIRRRASAVMPHVNQVRRRELERAAEALVRWSLTV